MQAFTKPQALSPIATLRSGTSAMVRRVFLSTCVWLSLTAMGWAQPRVEMELATEPDFPIDGQRAWLELLGKMDVGNLRIRSGRPGDRPEVVVRGKGASTVYAVRGLLTDNNQLIVPQGKFSLADSAKIRKWIEKLKAGGEEQLTAKPSAFGLYPKDLVAIHTALATPLLQTTKGEDAVRMVQAIAKNLASDLELRMSPQVDEALRSEGEVRDELQGVSCGTALAAILRPAGLVFAPEKGQGGKFRITVGTTKEVPEAWPVGWPPKDRPSDALPAIMNYLNVELKATPLAEALPAIAGKLKAPLLIDHNGLARKKIDLEETKADLPKARMFYGKILDRILFSARLKYEVRIDEADKPFLWIAPL